MCRRCRFVTCFRPHPRMCYGAGMAGRARLGVVVMTALLSVAAAAPSLSPEETLRRYLQAVKDAKFDVAWGLISRAMKGGKEREVWIKEQERLMQWADVK